MHRVFQPGLAGALHRDCWHCCDFLVTGVKLLFQDFSVQWLQSMWPHLKPAGSTPAVHVQNLGNYDTRRVVSTWTCHVILMIVVTLQSRSKY